MTKEKALKEVFSRKGLYKKHPHIRMWKMRFERGGLASAKQEQLLVLFGYRLKKDQVWVKKI